MTNPCTAPPLLMQRADRSPLPSDDLVLVDGVYMPRNEATAYRAQIYPALETPKLSQDRE